MGRRKIGKPRRPRRNETGYTLHQLRPPGDAYEEWFSVPGGIQIDSFRADPRFSGESVDLIERIARLAIPYQREVPMAAVLLDMAMDSGYLPLKRGDDEAALVPLEEATSMLTSPSATPTQQELRDSFHKLHAVGAVLVEEIDGATLVRPGSRPSGGGKGDTSVSSVPNLPVRTKETHARVPTSIPHRGHPR